MKFYKIAHPLAHFDIITGISKAHTQQCTNTMHNLAAIVQNPMALTHEDLAQALKDIQKIKAENEKFYQQVRDWYAKVLEDACPCDKDGRLLDKK